MSGSGIPVLYAALMKDNLDGGLTVTMIPVDMYCCDSAPPQYVLVLTVILWERVGCIIPTVGVCCPDSIFRRCVLALTVLSGCV